MLARQMNRALEAPSFEVIGENLANMEKKDGQMYKGPSWFVDGANANIYGGIYR
jgi:hypothetical protein